MAISLPDTSLPKKGPGSLPTAANDLDIQQTHQHHSLASNSEDDLSISEATFVSEAIDSLSISKQQIVDGIVGLYVEQIDDWTTRLASYVKGATGTIETGHGSHKSQDLSYVPAGSTSCPSQKRKRQVGDGRDEDREDDDSDSRGKKPKPDNDAKDGNCAPLACPCYKFDRWPCELRSCKGPEWPMVVRVKYGATRTLFVQSSCLHNKREHVYRCHSVPKYICIRCQRDLKTAALLQDHAQEAQSCEQQTPRFTYQAGQVLESNLRNRQGLNKLDRLEKWRKAYKMIFDVEDSHIPDPRMGFGDKSTPESLGDFLRRGMPGQIRRLATAEVDRLFVPQAEACQALMVKLIVGLERPPGQRFRACMNKPPTTRGRCIRTISGVPPAGVPISSPFSPSQGPSGFSLPSSGHENTPMSSDGQPGSSRVDSAQSRILRPHQHRPSRETHERGREVLFDRAHECPKPSGLGNTIARDLLNL
ncbi:uncharacterized protein VDAG_03111 [Verticillium dahliae VdLs.17]|uniref:C2H2-type domain-containing protein n=1 Tax=Verticillium dahliae (strain VdLs.17 / ATCC MYA-4575 / FGSC 10137) TaxID=498257 RepID=G2WYL9_VERDV|nr:uncharacterized protein VDAG_03111 [Verticillium dahliae VdLs.17]EGY21671.1 hypothetical protein VDAG_03111 [Verticillium dahliae VdLs.17]